MGALEAFKTARKLIEEVDIYELQGILTMSL
jgi:hypothetical protein